MTLKNYLKNYLSRILLEDVDINIETRKPSDPRKINIVLKTGRGEQDIRTYNLSDPKYIKNIENESNEKKRKIWLTSIGAKEVVDFMTVKYRRFIKSFEDEEIRKELVEKLQQYPIVNNVIEFIVTDEGKLEVNPVLK